MAAVIIRTDGSPVYGMGHVMRGIALAQAIKVAGHEPLFVCKDLRGSAHATIEDYGFEATLVDGELGGTAEAEVTQAVASARGARAIIVDLNHVGTLANEAAFLAFLRGLDDAGFIVVAIEGLNSECISLRTALPVSAIVLPYLGAESLQYNTRPGVKVLAGAQYFPFRAEFLVNTKRTEPIADIANRILVTIGGGDVAQYNQKIFDALCLVPVRGLQVQMTGAAPQPNVASDVQLAVVSNSRTMAKLLRWADLAVIGSGLTRYEAALVATPSVVVSVRREHEPMTVAFARTGAAVNAGSIIDATAESLAVALNELIGDPGRRRKMSKCAEALTDGQGAARIVDAIGQFVATR